MNDYTPYLDLHPELELVSSATVRIGIRNFQQRFDYVQDLNRKSKNGKKEVFHLLVKDGKLGLLLYSCGLFCTTVKIVLPAIYDDIKFLYKCKKSLGAIVEQNRKFGLFFWEYGVVSNKSYSVPVEYDSLERLENKRIKGVKDNNIIYFDETGHVLK